MERAGMRAVGAISQAFGINVASPSFTSAGDSGTRTSTTGMPTDTRREITGRTRLELVKKSRWLNNNLGLFRRFTNGTARYAVGNGISHIPDTTDLEWNKKAEKYFENWASNEIMCDVRGRVSFWRMQKYLLRAMVRDGDSFVLKTPTKDQVMTDGTVVPGLPQLQWLESTMVGNVQTITNINGFDAEGYRDGILATPQSKVIRYKILQDRNPQAYDLSTSTTVSADNMRHLFDSERATSLRGLPWGYHGMNSGLDILDMTSLEKASNKLHAAMAGAIKKRAPDSAKGFGGGLRKTETALPDGKKRVTSYDNFAGGAGILQLDLDEEFDLFTSKRESTTFTGFIDFLVRDMAWGLGVPPEFIWSVAGLGGPNGRMILEDAKWFFEEVQDLMVDLLCRPIYTWVISRAILRKELPPCNDPEWWTCHWQGPAKITIDQGKEGAIELQRLASGCGTWEEFWAARGKNGRKMVFKRIDELAEAMEYAASKKGVGHEEGVPFEYVVTMKPGTPTDGNNADGTNGGQQDTQPKK
jgi:capsid protein